MVALFYFKTKANKKFIYIRRVSFFCAASAFDDFSLCAFHFAVRFSGKKKNNFFSYFVCVCVCVCFVLI